MATQKSFVKNPSGSQIALKGNTAKPKTNPALIENRARHHKSRRRFRRNPSASSVTAGLVGAFGGALVINGFDAICNRVAPNTSGLLRTIGKFGVGFLIGMYGNKLPIIKGFAPLISNSLYLAGALDVVSTYVMPWLMNTVSNFQLPSLASLTGSTSTGGQLGQVMVLPNGQRAMVYDNRRNVSSYGGYNPSRTFAHV